MKKILWLASYPKSGNTWFRAFLRNLLGASDPALPPPESGHAAEMSLLEQFVGADLQQLSAEELLAARPKAYELQSCALERPVFVKIHDRVHPVPGGAPLVPAAATKGAVYLVRNPLDVAPSWADHRGCTLEIAARHMSKIDAAMGPKNTDQTQCRQSLSSWGQHVASWIDQDAFPVHVVRYEDMLYEPEPTFAAAVAFCGLPHGMEQVRAAVAASSFDKLQAEEAQGGFRERSPASKRFFRRGKAGAWRDDLSEQLAGEIIEAHAPMMRRLGYLDASGQPVF